MINIWYVTHGVLLKRVIGGRSSVCGGDGVLERLSKHPGICRTLGWMTYEAFRAVCNKCIGSILSSLSVYGLFGVMDAGDLN